MSDADVSTPDQDTLPGHGPGSLGPLKLGAASPVRLGAAIRLGALAARGRIFRRPTALSALLGLALIVVSSTIERRVGSAGAVSRVLVSTFRIIIPMVTFGVVSAA